MISHIYLGMVYHLGFKGKKKTQNIHNAKENDIDNNFKTFTFEKNSLSL
jgi:hypothetical protein